MYHFSTLALCVRGYALSRVLALLAVGILLLLSHSAMAETSNLSEADPGNPEGQLIIAAYFLIFDEGYDQTMTVPDSIPWNKINRLYIAFATVNDGVLTEATADGTSAEEAEGKIRKVIDLCRNGNPDAEIFISSNYGGQSADDKYLEAAKDPQRFADSVLDLLRKYDLDGYDMDWETSRINDYADELYALLSACNATLKQAGPNPHGKPYKVSHAIWPTAHSPGTVAGLRDYIDNINLMTYGAESGDDLRSYAESYHDAGFPYEKMIGGADSELGYAENGGPDTQDSIQEKCNFAEEKNLAGMYSWRLDNDMRAAGGPPTFQAASWIYDAMTG